MEWRQSLHSEFEVSEYGHMRALVDRYRRPSGTVIHGRLDSNGYLEYSVQAPGQYGRSADKSRYRAHTLVLHAFVGACPPDKNQCAHYDGDRVNNHYTNLRWATAVENTEDKLRHGNIYSGPRRLTEEQVRAMRKMRSEGASYAKILSEFSLSKGNLSSIINRKTWGYLSD
jgi:hypothetical protein